jgi:hypothetical protein
MGRYIIQTAVRALSHYCKYKNMISLSWLIHSPNDLMRMVKAKGTAVSVEANMAYRGAEVRLILKFGSREKRVVRFILQLFRSSPQYLLNRGLGWPQNQCGQSEEDKIYCHCQESIPGHSSP